MTDDMVAPMLLTLVLLAPGVWLIIAVIVWVGQHLWWVDLRLRKIAYIALCVTLVLWLIAIYIVLISNLLDQLWRGR